MSHPVRVRTGPVLAGLLAAGLSLGGCVGAVVGGAAAVGTTAMQDRGLKGAATDNAIVLEINNYWFQEGKSTLFSNISTQIYEGRVLLTGAVTNPDTRAEAVRLAWKASGVREIINEIEVTDEGGLKAYAKDVWAANELRSRLLFAKGINSVNYSVDVVNGTVYIIGVYADQAEHDRVLAVARNMSNIKRVVSHAIARDDPRRFRAPPGEAGAAS
ncbi:MAG: BON domain-containing protein [Alphaproteobacteria bacterium]|nr:BON domain-containing protein [Alphaproteobacteria bacterium]